MADFPYMSNPSNLKKFITHVQGAGVPPKVTLQYLVGAGFKSKNDRGILAIIKDLGFVDSSGVPTDLWRAYRNKDRAGSVMATALKSTYAGLFQMYPDAFRKDNEALRNFFSSHTSVGEAALVYIVRTFKALCELADFEAEDDDAFVSAVVATVPEKNSRPNVPPAGSVLTVNINVQLQLPATDDSSIYDNLFAAMKKHLFTETAA